MLNLLPPSDQVEPSAAQAAPSAAVKAPPPALMRVPGTSAAATPAVMLRPRAAKAPASSPAMPLLRAVIFIGLPQSRTAVLAVLCLIGTMGRRLERAHGGGCTIAPLRGPFH